MHERGGALPVVLDFLARVHGQHQRGGALPEMLAQPVLQQLGPDLMPEVVAGIERADIVCRDGGGDWLPARDFDRVSVDDVVRALPGYWLESVETSRASAWHERLAERWNVRLAREDALALSLAELFMGLDDTEAAGNDRITTLEDGRLSVRG